MMAFTLVFAGDIRQFDGNPLQTETPFGVPYAAGVGDAFELLDEVEGKLQDIMAALTTDKGDGV